MTFCHTHHHHPHPSEQPGCWRRVTHVLAGLALGVLLALGFAIVVRLLWNGLMPSIFNVRPINYCQAIGLLILSRLLVGGLWHGRGGHGGPCGCHHRRHQLPEAAEAAEAAEAEGPLA